MHTDGLVADEAVGLGGEGGSGRQLRAFGQVPSPDRAAQLRDCGCSGVWRRSGGHLGNASGGHALEHGRFEHPLD